MKHILKNLLEIQKVKGQGESILDAESRFLEEKDEAKRSEKRKRAIEE